VNTHTNNLSNLLLSAAQGLFLAVFLVNTAWPQYALAAAEITNPAKKLTFSAAHAYTIEKGSVLGVIATAYSSTPDQTSGNPFITASGTRVRPGVAAANFLPIGTVVRVGNTTYTVEDRLNARYNNTYRFDIWMESREQARAFGIRRVLLEIVSLP
jgi:3D (Asp-Asp-Asp) domain-containing protein